MERGQSSLFPKTIMLVSEAIFEIVEDLCDD